MDEILKNVDKESTAISVECTKVLDDVKETIIRHIIIALVILLGEFFVGLNTRMLLAGAQLVNVMLMLYFVGRELQKSSRLLGKLEGILIVIKELDTKLNTNK